jgi:hypothetical protein
LFKRAFAKYIEDLTEKKAKVRAEYNILMSDSNALTQNSRSSIANLALTSYAVIEVGNTSYRVKISLSMCLFAQVYVAENGKPSEQEGADNAVLRKTPKTGTPGRES